MGDREAIRAAFDAHAKAYDPVRRQLIPCFDDFYGMVGTILPFPAGEQIEILDLGAGTGLLSGMLAAYYAKATFTLVDISEEMLARARERFADRDGVRFIVADYSQQPLEGQFDAIVSALSIHHLEHEEKRDLFRRCYHAVKPGGFFVNADEVLASTPAVEAFNQAEWERQVTALGGRQEIAAARERMSHDIPARVEEQLAWLREAGFDDADCYYKNLMFVVYAGRKPG
jgi:tRNA (cmo5U34)-methyltransferase